MAKRKSPGVGIAEEVKPVFEEILGLVDAFCNRHKGTDVASIDDETARVVRLFHPRRDRWARHFRLRGAILVGRTAVGRVTLQLLQFNRPDRIRMRRTLIAAGCYPR